MLKSTLMSFAMIGVAMAAGPSVSGPVTSAAAVGDPSHQYPFFQLWKI